jgi:hypothetical protein
LWWLLLFGVTQFFTVLAAPKPKDDVPAKKRRHKKVKPAPVPKPKEPEEPGLFEWDEIKPKPLDK